MFDYLQLFFQSSKTGIYILSSSSFSGSSLYENPSSAKPLARPDTIRCAPLSTPALAASTSVPTSLRHSPSPVDLVVLHPYPRTHRYPSKADEFTDTTARNAPPPGLNLTSASIHTLIHCKELKISPTSFWFQHLKQYDTNDTRTISHLQLVRLAGQ